MANRIALTVDLEPDWGVRGTRAYREVTPRFLRFLEERDLRATFFVVSDLLDVGREPLAAAAERNEIASHGRSHRLLNRLSRAETLGELEESRLRLSDCAQGVRGFRAPFFRRCPDFDELLTNAGYAYDASLGTVWPGPWNRRLHALECPHRAGGVWEFPTSAMAAGMLPLSLTWLRLFAPHSLGWLPRRPRLLYLHLHEFLPAQTASCLPSQLRWTLTRNCGRRAWDVLDRAVDAMGGRMTTCADVLTDMRSEDG